MLKPQYWRVLLILGFFFLFCLQGKAQTPVIDSLRILFHQAGSDTQKVVLCQKLLRNFYLRSSDSTLLYLRKGQTIAKRMDAPKWLANFTYIRALVYEQTDSRKKAIEQYLKARPFYERLKDSTNLLKVHAALVSRYNEIDNLEAALKHFDLAKNYLKEDNIEGQASLNNRIGLIYGERAEYQTALRYFQQNLPLYLQLNNQYGLGFTYENIGSSFDGLGQLDSAFFYLKKGIAHQRLANRPHALAENLSALGDFYIKQEKYELALNYVQEATELMKTANMPFSLVDEYTKLANIYLQLKDFSKSIGYGENALKLANETQAVNFKQKLLTILAKSHVAANDFQTAYQYSQQQIEIRDSLTQEVSKKAILELEAKYQNQQKQAQIDLQNSQLSRQRLLLIAAGIIGGLLFTLIFFIYRTAIERKKINAELRQLDETKSNFFANISHELRTPLTLILGPLENALQAKSKNVSKEDIQLAHSNSQKLLSLVNEILDLSKL